MTQDTYRGDRSRTYTLNYYAYCAGNPISYTDPSGHAIWGVVGAAMGAYDGYKYAKKKKLKGWKKAAAIAGGAALGAINPFKVVKAVSKAGKFAKTAVKSAKALKASKKTSKIAKATKGKKLKVVKPNKKLANNRYNKATNKIVKKASTGTGLCFVAGTKIHTKEGFKNIEAIKPGDYVWSEDPTTNEKALKSVKKIFVREKDSIIRLSINGEIIETTKEHPFYVEGRGFITAAELKVGDEVRLFDEEEAYIDGIEEIQFDEPIKVYNFEVEDFHTYYVSGQKVLVHNTCAVENAGNKKPDFIATPSGVIVDMSKDYNLVPVKKVNAIEEHFLQIHNSYKHGQYNSHVHKPILNKNPNNGKESISRRNFELTVGEIEFAHEKLKAGIFRERIGRNDKGGD